LEVVFGQRINGKEYQLPTTSNGGLQAVDKESAAVLNAFTVLFFCVEIDPALAWEVFQMTPQTHIALKRLREKHLCKVNMCLTF